MTRTIAQAFALKKRSFSLRDAVAFGRRHGAIKVEEYRTEYRVRMQSPRRVREQGFTRFRRFTVAPGIDLIIGAKESASNPPRGTSGVIPGEIEKIFYHRSGSRHPGPYQHRFGPGAMMFPLPNGDVLIRSMTGKKLWGRF